MSGGRKCGNCGVDIIDSWVKQYFRGILISDVLFVVLGTLSETSETLSVTSETLSVMSEVFLWVMRIGDTVVNGRIFFWEDFFWKNLF